MWNIKSQQLYGHSVCVSECRLVLNLIRQFACRVITGSNVAALSIRYLGNFMVDLTIYFSPYTFCIDRKKKHLDQSIWCFRIRPIIIVDILAHFLKHCC